VLLDAYQVTPRPCERRLSAIYLLIISPLAFGGGRGEVIPMDKAIYASYTGLLVGISGYFRPTTLPRELYYPTSADLTRPDALPHFGHANTRNS
jgi:hypothetical protein